MALWSANYSNAQVELDPSQTYNTGNIVVPTTTTSGSTWVGGVYQDGVNCMGGGGPGYCGPNPIVRPDGNINFSYGSVYLYQEQLTAGLLPSITGLQIRGYDFSFTAKNGNGWDDGRVDQLSALVRFWDNTTGKAANNLVYGNSWNLSYRFNWTNFTFSETFNSPYDANSIGRVQYGFIGKDNNFWAGHYGPEIRDVSFNIRYGVDPCASDPLFSPTCPGYLTALQSLVPAMTPTAEVVAQPEPIAEVQTVATLAPATQQSVSTQEPTQQQVAAAEQKQEQSNEKKEGASLSLILSVVRQEQSRISSVEQSVVADSVSQALKELSQVSADAEAVAQQSSSQSQEQAASLDNQQAQQQSITTQQTTTQSFSISLPNENRSNQQTATSQTNTQEANQVSSVEQLTIQFQPPSQDSSQQTNMSVGALEIKQPEPIKVDDTGTQSLAITIVDQKPNVVVQTQPIQQEQISFIPQSLLDPIKVESIVDTNFSVTYSLLPERRPQEEIELPKVEELKVGAKTPADDFLEPKTFTFDQNQSQTNDSVKKQSQTNELAVGVSFDNLATTPTGFGDYNVALKDAAFYAPKEIYKGQKTVDNVKALRQLASDKLHQEMVEQQYRR